MTTSKQEIRFDDLSEEPDAERWRAGAFVRQAAWDAMDTFEEHSRACGRCLTALIASAVYPEESESTDEFAESLCAEGAGFFAALVYAEHQRQPAWLEHNGEGEQ